MTRLSRLRFTLGLSCRDRGILAGTEGRDPGQRFPVEHVEALPLGGQLAAPLIELVAEVSVLLFQLVDEFPGGGRHGVRWRPSGVRLSRQGIRRSVHTGVRLASRGVRCVRLPIQVGQPHEPPASTLLSP